MNDAVKSVSELRRLIENVPPADQEALRIARERQAVLTKPPGALGRLEEIAEWLAAWQGRHPPRTERVQIIVFAANHGIGTLLWQSRLYMKIPEIFVAIGWNGPRIEEGALGFRSHVSMWL